MKLKPFYFYLLVTLNLLGVYWIDIYKSITKYHCNHLEVLMEQSFEVAALFASYMFWRFAWKKYVSHKVAKVFPFMFRQYEKEIIDQVNKILKQE